MKDLELFEKYMAIVDRDAVLKMMGFYDYSEYLQSSLWGWIRNQLETESDAGKCFCCESRTGLVWHHRIYSPRILVGNFSNVDKCIVRLCSPCHRAVHFKVDGTFIACVVDVDSRFLKLQGASTFRGPLKELYETLDLPPEKNADFSGPGGY